MGKHIGEAWLSGTRKTDKKKEIREKGGGDIKEARHRRQSRESSIVLICLRKKRVKTEEERLGREEGTNWGKKSSRCVKRKSWIRRWKEK